MKGNVRAALQVFEHGPDCTPRVRHDAVLHEVMASGQCGVGQLGKCNALVVSIVSLAALQLSRLSHGTWKKLMLQGEGMHAVNGSHPP